MRPTPRLALVLAAAAPLSIIAGGLAPKFWIVPFIGAALLLLAFALDAALTLPRRRLTLDCTLPPRMFIGETATLTVRIAAPPGRVTKLDLLIQARGDIAAPDIHHYPTAPGKTAIVLLPIVPRRRGRIDVATLLLRWRGPLGLNQRVLAFPINRALDVVPNIRGVQTGALDFYDRDAPAGLKLQRDRGAGTEFDALREYMPGMDIAGVDWKHSARHRRLVAKEFRVERNHPVVLAFDTGHLMSSPIHGIPRLDHAISAGLLLGWVALRGGDMVGTYGFDSRIRHWGPPQRGTPSFARLQHQAASLAYAPEETNFTLGLAELSSRLKRRALVVLFTDFVDTITAELMTESLQRLTGRHVVVFVSLRDPGLQALMDAPPHHAGALGQAVVASDFLRERRAVFARLERMGVQCLDVDRQAISARLVNRYVAIKQRGLL
jgi:uncharacterized protein (DUF58 family)